MMIVHKKAVRICLLWLLGVAIALGIQQPASTPQQQLPPSLSLRPRVISLNVMVAGLSGLGKTTTCEALLQSWIQQEEEISKKKIFVEK